MHHRINKYATKTNRRNRSAILQRGRRQQLHQSGHQNTYPENLVYVEEPVTDEECSDDTDEFFYESSTISRYEDEDYYGQNVEDDIIFYYVDDKNIPHAIEMNDELNKQTLEDELFESNCEMNSSCSFDSSSGSDSESEQNMIDLNDELEEQALCQLSVNSRGLGSSESSDSDMERGFLPAKYDRDFLESVRKKFAEKFASSHESSSEDSDFGSDIEFSYEESDSDMPADNGYDAGHVRDYDSNKSSSSSEGEGVTIYSHSFDLPECLEDESSNEELLANESSLNEYDSEGNLCAQNSDNEEFTENTSSDDEYDSEGNLCAQDSDNETFTAIDSSDHMVNLKDCELLEIENDLYKLILRLPSSIKNQTKIDFKRRKNELIVSGKLAYYQHDDADDEDDPMEGDSSDSRESSDNSSDSNDGESDEENFEDTKHQIKKIRNQDMAFEMHFQFEKAVKADEIKASYNWAGELELLIPCEDEKSYKRNSCISIEIQNGDSDDESTTEEISAY